MKQVVAANTRKIETPITPKECHDAELYFMVYKGVVHFLHRNRKMDNMFEYAWLLSPGVVMGGNMRSIEEAINYGLAVGGKIYEFKDWSEVLPDLL